MTRTVETDTDDGGCERPRREHVHSRGTRLAGSAGAAAVVVAAVALTPLAPDDRPGYVLAHALAAIPLLLAALVWASRARRTGAPEYRTFWGHWCHACVVALGSAASGVAAFAWPPLLAVDLVLLVAAAPFWFAAGREVGRIESGRLDPAVDMVDSAMAVAVLGAPSVLLLAEPLLEAGELLSAPLALFLVLTPAGLYGAALSLGRLPRGERLTHALGAALVVTFTLSVALQVTRLAGGLDAPPSVLVGAHALNLAVVAALPLWAHRRAPRGLVALPVERQVRRNPMPTISAVLLPLVAGYVLVWRRDDTWAVVYLAVVLLAVVGLNALRHSMLSREAQRLSGDLARMAEDRRLLLADMVRALDDDRRRILAELHSQAVGSLSTLGTVVQTACVALPASTALAVRESIAHLQGDLSERAEELRLLLVALRPPPLGTSADGPARDDVLAAALRAYAADLSDAAPADRRPQVEVAVDPGLELDRRIATIACRVAEEALLTAVLHARARRVGVSVRSDAATGGVVVEVRDDGEGLDLAAVAGGSSLESLEMFTDIGHGELTVRSVPGRGTVVRSRIGGRAPGASPSSPDATGTAPDALRLRVVDEPAGRAAPSASGAATSVGGERAHLRPVT